MKTYAKTVKVKCLHCRGLGWHPPTADSGVDKKGRGPKCFHCNGRGYTKQEEVLTGADAEKHLRSERRKRYFLIGGVLVLVLGSTLLELVQATGPHLGLPVEFGYVVWLIGILITGTLFRKPIEVLLAGAIPVIGGLALLSLASWFLGSPRGLKGAAQLGLVVLGLVAVGAACRMLQKKVSVRARVLSLVAFVTIVGGAFWLRGESDFEAEEQVGSLRYAQPVVPERVIGGKSANRLVVVASGDKLSPIRITTDQSIRRPYWIEHESALQFNWNKRIVLEGDLPSATVLLNGNTIYQIQDSTRRRVELTDSAVASYLRHANGEE